MPELISAFSTAKSVGGDRVRFEIDGVNFRLIAAFNFKRQIAFVKFIGTHAEIARLWNAPDDSPEADVMDALATLVDAYERRRWPVAPSTPLEMLKFCMEQNDYTQADLAKLLGSRSRASEILHGKRGLTLDTIRLLAKRWRIPAALLIGDLEEA